MRNMIGTKTSTHANVKDVVGGRKTESIAAREGTEGAVLVDVDHDDAVVFSDEVESVPSLNFVSESDDDEEEEEVEDWDSDEESLEDDEEDAELDEGLAERRRIFADARALKVVAVAYAHPEFGVTCADGACFARNYFNRPSAPESEEDELADERAEVLAEAAALKKLAVDYMHPEAGVTATDATVFGRNYFSRPSAPDVEDSEEAEERACVLAEAAALKKSAMDYMHPEVGVVSADGACFGRNYFERPSAPEVEDVEDAEERAHVLAEAAALKKSAVAYMHPEVGVTSVDGACFGRNYFDCPSAAEIEEDEFADERAEILEEAAALKKSAMHYMHPEVGITTTDGAAFGRNYFSRSSAPEVEDVEDANERALVLAEAVALKKSSMGYMHPEVGVTSTDGASFGRNYFERPSAPEAEEEEDAEERARVLAEAVALKKAAMGYMHPEIGVASADGACFGRNYFSRPSAPEVEEDEFADERADVLAEAAALKKSAVDYMHPEVGVKAVDATLFGRNYFSRPAAAVVEEDEFAGERAKVLAEAAALKKLAADYMHPEVGVKATDGAAFGRNYFSRPSAPEVEDEEDAEERALVLAESAALKKSAMHYMHPEVGVVSADGACFGRNYFSRPSAPEVEEDGYADERAEILEEAAALKKSAMDYMHPEVGVTTTDATLFGRNFFSRPSAPETEGAEDAEERARVLAEAVALKKSAVDYMHPEVGVTTTDATLFGRNYFSRPSALETEGAEDAEERVRVLAEAVALKKSAVDYMHPEVGVTTTDGTAFGRNYFNRYSAFEVDAPKKQTESPEASQDVATVQNLAAAVKGANLPSTKSTKLSSSDMDVTSGKKSASSVNLFGLSEPF